MTLVMAWLNKTNAATALHIASESRFSGGSDHWDYGPKIFRLFPTRDYLAYCGDVRLALSLILQGTAVLANTNTLRVSAGQKPIATIARVRALCTLFDVPVKAFPSAWRGPTTLLYCGFDQLRKQFQLFKLSLTKQNQLNPIKVDLYKERVACFGSGQPNAQKALATGMKTGEIFGVLVSVIADKSVPSVGGVPQMVTIKKSTSHPVGFNWDTDGTLKNTLFGLPLHFRSNMKRVEFRDKQFRLKPYLG